MTTEPATLEAARAAAAAEQAERRRRFLKAAHEAAQDAFWAAAPDDRAAANAALKAARDARRADEAGVTLEAWLGRRTAVQAAIRAELAAYRAALKVTK